MNLKLISRGFVFHFVSVFFISHIQKFVKSTQFFKLEKNLWMYVKVTITWFKPHFSTLRKLFSTAQFYSLSSSPQNKLFSSHSLNFTALSSSHITNRLILSYYKFTLVWVQFLCLTLNDVKRETLMCLKSAIWRSPAHNLSN